MKQVKLGCMLFTCALLLTVFMIMALHIMLQVFSALHGF